MNRQRRLEAIARRQAFIDSQIQMLSCQEARVPNIIRNRSGRALPAKAKSFQAVNYLENKGNVFSNSLQNISRESVDNSTRSLQVASSQSSSAEDVYVAVLNDEIGHEDQTEMTLKIEGAENENNIDGGIPITLSEEMAKMLANATGTTEQLIRTLKTIQTEDGTIMVVLEGNNFTENEMETPEGNVATLSTEREESSELLLQSSHMPHVPVNEVRNGIETKAEYEESYVIVQTDDGDVLVPSSKLYSQFQTPSVSSDESIVQFIATESGAIENIMSNKSSSNLSFKSNSAVSRQSNHNVPKLNKATTAKVSSSAVSCGSAIKKPNVKNLGIGNRCKNLPHPKVLKKKSINTFDQKVVRNIVQPNAKASDGTESLTRRVVSLNAEEKPRPFRFELPELEDHLNEFDDCFMTVPVPIKIESLRSETEKGQLKPGAKSESSLSLSHHSVVTTVSEASTGNSMQLEPDEDTDAERHKILPDLNGLSQEIPTATCQQCNQQFSSETTLLAHKQNDNCNSFLQCVQCFDIFNSEYSFTDHLEHCETNQRNNMNANMSLAHVNADGESHIDTESVEENLIIKSVNSLSVPAEVADKSQLTISSPVHSNGDEVSGIHVVDHPTTSPTTIFVSSSDLNQKNDTPASFCVPLVNDCENTNHSSSKRAKLSSNCADSFINVSNELSVLSPDQQTETSLPKCIISARNLNTNCSYKSSKAVRILEGSDVGRRTLNKASAKANMNMSSEIGGDCEVWDCNEVEVEANQPEDNKNSVSIQSARIRSGSDRIKIVEKSVTNEEELGFNFRNLFEQVVKQSVTFN